MHARMHKYTHTHTFANTSTILQEAFSSVGVSSANLFFIFCQWLTSTHIRAHTKPEHHKMTAESVNKQIHALRKLQPSIYVTHGAIV